MQTLVNMVAQLMAAAVWSGAVALRGTPVGIIASLPSTLLHEMAHWTVALVTGGRPALPSVVPYKEGKGWVLGEVVFHAGRFNSAPITLAPLWCLAPLATWGLFVRNPTASWAHEAWAGVLFGFMALACVPSRTDWGIALQRPMGLPIVALMLWFEAHYVWSQVAG